MASGYKAPGAVDLDDIFALRGSLTPIANVGYLVGSQDMSDRFAPVSFGTPAASATGFKNSGGTDLQNVFAKIGSLVLELIITSGYDDDLVWEYNVQTFAEAAVGVGNIPPLVRVTVQNGAMVRQLVSGTLPGSLEIVVDAGGLIEGRAGQPGTSSGGDNINGGNGGDGGDAISTSVDISVANAGVIRGGGGGGGGGGSGGLYVAAGGTQSASGGQGGTGDGGKGNGNDAFQISSVDRTPSDTQAGNGWTLNLYATSDGKPRWGRTINTAVSVGTYVFTFGDAGSAAPGGTNLWAKHGSYPGGVGRNGVSFANPGAGGGGGGGGAYGAVGGAGGTGVGNDTGGPATTGGAGGLGGNAIKLNGNSQTGPLGGTILGAVS